MVYPNMCHALTHLISHVPALHLPSREFIPSPATSFSPYRVLSNPARHAVQACHDCFYRSTGIPERVRPSTCQRRWLQSPCEQSLCVTIATRTRHHHLCLRRKEANEVAFSIRKDVANVEALPRTHNVGLRLRLSKADEMNALARVCSTSFMQGFIYD